MIETNHKDNFLIDGENKNLEINDIISISKGEKNIIFTNELLEFLQKGRDQLENKLKENVAIYGINTGFGGNGDLIIPFDKLDYHQSNLLDFLTCGTGDFFNDQYVRGIQFIIIIALSRGWSGVRPMVIQTLAKHLNKGIIPQVPMHGSVGASGDLVPLSYIANVLCGKGMVKYNEKLMNASDALKITSIEPLVLKSKEGLALVNGTRVMSSVSCISINKFETIFKAAIGSIALAVEGLLASKDHYDMRIHNLKNHPGQILIAQILNKYFNTSDNNTKSSNITFNQSENVQKLDKSVQEVYSLRCAPQILGIISENISNAKIVIKREILSVNDNPLIDPYYGDVLSGGNFMGNHIARIMDGIKLDISLVANHLHSLVALMMHSEFSKGLPNSLSPNPGIYQGYKGMQISQTSLVVWLRQEAAPACIHSLTTEQFNQDIVSLGLHSANGAASMLIKLCDIVSMTLIIAFQAISLRMKSIENFKLPNKVQKLYSSIIKIIPILENDRRTDIDVREITNAILQDKLDFINLNL
ncbi:hypothetical protein DDB_G0273081 [Dictyostelium discoideum AX4]|uniref:hal-like protein DDB_G0273787/DDB_G0273081 n=1 Tax=Dictyostelium discoideum TaxID=44689 RepID=HALL_DICDI|nr:hypothetical protein DDB_G0273787 [Dictyostelium discoideum AX4]XP_644740.1 hypothetical protein DDB_G0273081 [Dictyostelium discoideum AX4]Q556V9.1 RecName: Full=hal-like protein DDB_G0273787/DDB_G0273081 [Dictyostelium discoideum]AKE50814.1 phenylalanine ammonia-lyase [synthetic construct]EAL70584.1 hypothetical protein DDB_G0273787 [Dictyostelium discoideum AX4]EAL70758.1 hypothetical protein DDB_G0273081 [Dictyostelium discoideum AX4]|eukprot:XP_644510.1 hypothetical protein DDB_G0273787 [Dictyostelium discoideum AX4]